MDNTHVNTQLTLSRGDSFNKTRNTIIILALCSTLRIYLLMFQIPINSIQKQLSHVGKQNFNKNFNLIQGEIISTIHTTELYFLLCAVPHIYIY